MNDEVKQDFSAIRVVSCSCELDCVGIPMNTNCAPFVADLFLFRFEIKRDFMLSLSEDN